MPKISICIPTHNMKNKDFFLQRALDSIRSQTFQDYEIVITENGKMSENTNSAIKKAEGDLIKILYMDDWLSHENVLKDIVELMTFAKYNEWYISATDTNPNPQWTDNLETGNNKLGSPSALTFRNHFKDNLLFDEKMSWLLDCDLYKRMQKKYGNVLLWPHHGVMVNIGIHDGQMTNILTDEEKLLEHRLMKQKYA